MPPSGLPAGRPPGRQFPKSARVRKRREYLEIQGRGRRVSLPHFVFVVAARRRGPGVVESARLGVTASRKVGNAVVRNRCKRLVREAFRAVGAELFADDIDVIVIVKAAPPGLSLADVLLEWLSARGAVARRTQEARRLSRATSSDVE